MRDAILSGVSRNTTIASLPLSLSFIKSVKSYHFTEQVNVQFIFSLIPINLLSFETKWIKWMCNATISWVCPRHIFELLASKFFRDTKITTVYDRSRHFMKHIKLIQVSSQILNSQRQSKFMLVECAIRILLKSILIKSTAMIIMQKTWHYVDGKRLANCTGFL